MRFRSRMDMVLNMGFVRGLFSALVLVTGCAVLPVASFASETSDCRTADCGVSAGKKDEALEKDSRLAAQGDATAQMALGLRFLMGRGVPADEVKAQEWFLKSAQQGNVPAQACLASMLAFESDTQDLPAAARWFEKAALKGSLQAMSDLVRLYESGGGVTRDMAKAEEWRSHMRTRLRALRLEWAWDIARRDQGRWMKPGPAFRAADGAEKPAANGNAVDVPALKKAAENGDDHAQVVLGALLATGEGLARDEKAALQWFKKAADSDNAQAQAVLGRLYEMGWGGLDKDPEKAAKWTEKAALGGLVPAEAEWGSMLMEGKGVKKDPQKGLDWLVKAAQEGSGTARLLMGMMMLGQNDRVSAAKWFYGAVEVGDEEVLTAVGTLYGWGDGPVSGESEKLSEVRHYAQRGESEAQIMMGLLFGEGWGAARDPVKAEEWFDRAAVQNDAEVWLPLGLFYAESGRDDKAADAFDKAVASGGFSLARDRQMLQLMFVDSDKMPELGDALKHVTTTKMTAVKPGYGNENGKYGVKNGQSRDARGRDARIANKRAFLEREVKKGNPAAQLMLGTMLEQGWGVDKDKEAGVSLRSLGIDGMCRALKEKADEELLCSKDASDGNDGVKAVVPEKTAGEGSNVLKVTEGVK